MLINKAKLRELGYVDPMATRMINACRRNLSGKDYMVKHSYELRGKTVNAVEAMIHFESDDISRMCYDRICTPQRSSVKQDVYIELAKMLELANERYL